MPSEPLTRADLALIHDLQISAGEPKERYRERSARIVLDSMVEFVGLLDASGAVLELNQAALDALGIKLPEVEGKPFWTTPWWPASEAGNQALRESIGRASQGEVVRWETSVVQPTRGGETVIIDTSLTPVKDEHGKVVFLTVVGRDITAKKTQEREITHQGERARLAAIVESSDDAIISKDLNGIVTSWNAAAERMFGHTAEEIVGRSITTIIPAELHGDEEAILATLARGERIRHFETERVKKNGDRIEVSLTISPVRDEVGRIIGAAKIARDITQQKKTERALHTSERLASVGRLAATVAHEINNPLEAVTNLIYLARKSKDTEEVRRYLTAAEEELIRISHLTKQTLGFYRYSFTPVSTTLGHMVTSLVSVFASRIRNKEIEVSAEIEQNPEVVAVAGEIRQLLANLISNSIDAVPSRGKIRIRLSAVQEKGGERRTGVRLTVADCGPGIPEEIRARLFEPFFTTKKDVGTGLGLWVCKGIVDKHHGRIQVKSSTTPGRSWTAFSVFLPAEPPAARVEHGLKIAV